ncbi:hypothetical protein LVD15_05645 [Fulvivirga maritima]|uniref:hypothetical protein n=1 Tax=Fulvivirga maritima TaxID=2904247 RepID=UPI001F47A337|nr:hypothetical protein [Fulvivirga maritima]UII27904.1 hypothetical protein LVD15_05645 [Fulvivirga maritima]
MKSFFTSILILCIIGCSSKKPETEAKSEYSLNLIDSVKLNFPDSIPIQAGSIYRQENGSYLYVLKRAPNTIIVFKENGDFVTSFGGLGSAPDQFPFFVSSLISTNEEILALTGALMHVIHIDSSFHITNKAMVEDSAGTPIFKNYRVANNSDRLIALEEDSLLIVPIEDNASDAYTEEFYASNTIALVSPKGQLIKAFGEYESVFYEHSFLPHRNTSSITYNKKDKLIYQIHTGSEEVYNYDLDGNLVGKISHIGENIENSEIKGLTKEQSDGLWLQYWNQFYFYDDIYYDNHRGLLYRIYSEDTSPSKAKKLSHVYEKDSYLEVFEDNKYVSQVKLPDQLSWRIMDIDEEGKIYFKSKYKWQKEDTQEGYIYKYSLDYSDDI